MWMQECKTWFIKQNIILIYLISTTMAYRPDPDLEILSKASNEDLLLLADVLMYSDEKHRKKQSRRFATTLESVLK